MISRMDKHRDEERAEMKVSMNQQTGELQKLNLQVHTLVQGSVMLTKEIDRQGKDLQRVWQRQDDAEKTIADIVRKLDGNNL